METNENLKQLFTCWRAEQKNESEESQKRTRLPEVANESFVPDGIVDEEGYRNAKTKILIVAKEANCGGSDTSNRICECADEFWLSELANNSAKLKIFPKRLSMISYAIMNQKYELEKEDMHNGENLKSIAFMNLNKRGGYSYSNWEVLENYTKEYAKCIRKEIEIIEPDIIICCGKSVEFLLNEYVLNELKKRPTVNSVFHPSYFAISDKNYLKALNAVINGDENATDINRFVDKETVVERRGIIFDTNSRYIKDSENPMLKIVARGEHSVVIAYGEAMKNIGRLRIDDILFYYYKGRGIIAVAKVISEAKYCERDDSAYCDVVMKIPPQMVNGEFCAVKVDASFGKAISNTNHASEQKIGGFWLSGTCKRPYLYNETIKNAKNYICNEFKKMQMM